MAESPATASRMRASNWSAVRALCITDIDRKAVASGATSKSSRAAASLRRGCWQSSTSPPAEEAARHHELVGGAEANGLKPDEEAELARLKSILDGDYTPEQRQHAGVVLYVSYGGEVSATHAMVLPADHPAAADAGIIDRTQVAENDETASSRRRTARRSSPRR